MENITLEYIAGFFDGEGSIGVYYSKKTQDKFHLRTQLTQNQSKKSDLLMRSLVGRFQGNVSEQITLSGNVKYNWQLNSDLAATFLEAIMPYLLFKKDQAEIAIAWQKQRPKPTRDKQGRICVKRRRSVEFDIKVAKLVSLLKHQDIDEVMDNQKDLVDIKVELKPLAVIKG